MEQNETGQAKEEIAENQIPQPPRQEYVATIPVEPESQNPGRVEGIISLVCAGVSVFFFPLIFGITGIVLAAAARKKGSAKLGLAGIIISSVLMTVGVVLGVAMFLFEEVPESAAEGMMGIIFK